MRVLRVLPVVVLLGAALAGCSDSGGGAGAEDPTGGEHAQHGGVPAIDAPTWQVGQWWALSSEQSQGPFTHVVSGEAGDDWIVDTDSPDIAFFDARFDISFLGPVRKSDLAGSQGTDRVAFFQFPLTLNKTWTTPWDGQAVTITVTALADDRATLEARHANGTLYADYVYDGALGYFREYTFYGADGQAPQFAARVTGNGQGFTGDLARWTLEPLFEAHEAVGGRSTTFQVEPGLTDIWVDLSIACPQPGGMTVTFGPPTGPAEERGFTASGPCPAQVDETSTVAPPAQSEPWGVFMASAPPQNAYVDLVVLGRTQAVFKVGEAP